MDEPEKPQKPAKRPRRGGRLASADKSPEAHTERYMRGMQGGAAHAAMCLEGKARAKRLRELIEPSTEAMTKAIIQMVTDLTVHPAIRLDAYDKLMNRAYGKPKEHLVLEDDTGEGSSDLDEVTKLLNNVLEKVGAPKLEPPS